MYTHLWTYEYKYHIMLIIDSSTLTIFILFLLFMLSFFKHLYVFMSNCKKSFIVTDEAQVKSCLLPDRSVTNIDLVIKNSICSAHCNKTTLSFVISAFSLPFNLFATDKVRHHSSLFLIFSPQLVTQVSFIYLFFHVVSPSPPWSSSWSCFPSPLVHTSLSVDCSPPVFLHDTACVICSVSRRFLCSLGRWKMSTLGEHTLEFVLRSFTGTLYIYISEFPTILQIKTPPQFQSFTPLAT